MTRTKAKKFLANLNIYTFRGKDGITKSHISWENFIIYFTCTFDVSVLIIATEALWDIWQFFRAHHHFHPSLRFHTLEAMFLCCHWNFVSQITNKYSFNIGKVFLPCLSDKCISLTSFTRLLFKVSSKTCQQRHTILEIVLSVLLN